MIRVNLLPQKRRRADQGEGGQAWLLVVVLLLIAEVIGFFVFHGKKMETLEDQKRKNAELQAQIEKSKKDVADHNDVLKSLEQLRAREEAISKLQSARSGPTAMLLELARLLTPGRGPTIDPEKLNKLRSENPLAVYNPNWDSRRLWVNKFLEDRRNVRIEGVARDGEDQSEFAKRLGQSAYFYDVKVLPGKRSLDPVTHLDVVSFSLEAKVRY